MLLWQSARNQLKRLKYRNWAGQCPICERGVRFLALGPWYRDQLICGSCQSIPRERALIRVLTQLYPDWRRLRIHESSPGGGPASRKLARECDHYVASQYVSSAPPGATLGGGARNEDLGAQTFSDGSFDLVITQDVFEHLFEPDKAIAEIGRTLAPGGAHVMTVPIVNKEAPSERRASVQGGRILHHLEPQFHDNPVDPEGSLVTVDWGYDIADYLAHHSGMPTSIHTIDDMRAGIRAEYIEVVVSRKNAVPDLEMASGGPGHALRS